MLSNLCNRKRNVAAAFLLRARRMPTAQSSGKRGFFNIEELFFLQQSKQTKCKSICNQQIMCSWEQEPPLHYC